MSCAKCSRTYDHMRSFEWVAGNEVARDFRGTTWTSDARVYHYEVTWTDIMHVRLEICERCFNSKRRLRAVLYTVFGLSAMVVVISWAGSILSYNDLTEGKFIPFIGLGAIILLGWIGGTLRLYMDAENTVGRFLRPFASEIIRRAGRTRFLSKPDYDKQRIGSRRAR